MTDLPVLVTASVLLASVALPVAIGATLHKGARVAGLGPHQANLLAGSAVLLQFGWLAATAALASTGVYATWVGLGLAVPLVLGILALRLPSVAASLGHPRAVALLAAVQAVRVVGGVFLVLLAMHRLPPAFALPAGAGDVLVGLFAPVVAYTLWRRPRMRALGIAFNAFGLVDLIVAVSIGVLHSPGPLQLIVTEPTTEIMTMLPLTLIPTFVVPLAIVLHVASLRLLARQNGQGSPNPRAVGVPAVR